MKHRQQTRLQLALKINQHIAAGHQIEPQKRGVLHQILTRKYHHIPQVFVDLETVPVAHEVRLDPVSVHMRQTGGWKHATPGAGHGLEIDIGCKDLNAVLIKRSSELFGKQNGQRIGFFTCCTTGHPDTDVIAGALASQNARNHLFKCGKGFCIPEKRGDRYQNVLAQLVEFAGPLVHQRQIGRQGAHMVGRHAPLNAPPQRGLFVLRKIHLGAPAHLTQQGFECRWGVGSLRGHGNTSPVLHDKSDFGTHVFWRQNPVHATGVDSRLRHAVVLRGGGVLREGEATGRLDGMDARGTVGSGARQNNAYARVGSLVCQ